MEKEDMTWDDYKPWRVLSDFVRSLPSSNPSKVFLEDLGETLGGRRLLVIKLCSSGTCGEKPAMWLDGGTHAREWTTISSVTYIMNELINNESNYKEITDSLDWYFMPVVNPDGYEYSMTHDSNWRTNRANDSGCSGVDLNRNYPVNWKENECGESYSGPKPFSEVETKLQADFINTIVKNLKFYNTFHNYGELLLFPWAASKGKFPQEESYIKLGEKGLKSIAFKSGHKYEIGSVSQVLYTAHGSSLDYYTSVGVPYVFAIEIGKSFIPDTKDIIPLAKEVLEFHLSVAKQIIKEFGSNND